MQTLNTKEILHKLNRIEGLLVAYVLQKGAIPMDQLKEWGFSTQELKDIKKGAFDFDITKFVEKKDVEQWK